MNSQQKERLTRFIKSANELWNNPVSKVISVTDTLFIVFYKFNDVSQVIKINRNGVMSVPEYNTVYHSKFKPEVS